MSRIRFLYTKKCGEMIEIDNYLFRRNKGVYYKCCCSECNSTAKVTVDDDNNITGLEYVREHIQSAHDNKNDEERIDKLTKTYEIRKYAFQHPLEKNSDVCKKEEFKSFSSRDLSVLKCNFKRDKYIPKSFKELTEIDNHPMILSHDNDDMIILGFVSGLYILAQSDVILVDGTFKLVRRCGQMFIVHGIINNNCVGCLYIVMKNRSEANYLEVFKTIQGMGRKRGINIFDRDIVIKADFEKAVINTLKNLFPKLKFSGCFFHFTYNIMKNIRRIKLITLYDTDSQFKQMIRKLSCLALLPLKYISYNTINEIFESCTATDDDKENIEQFKKYFYKTWFGYSVGRAWINPLYSHKMWNVCGSRIRTNNLSEVTHKLINDKIKKTLDIMGVLEIVKESLERDKGIVCGTLSIQRKNISEQIDQALEIYLTKLEDNEIDVMNYLQIVSEIVQCKNSNKLHEVLEKYNVTPIDMVVLDKQINGHYTLDVHLNNGRIDGRSNSNNLGNQSRQTIRKPQFKRELKNNEITLGRKVDRLMNSRNRIGGTEIDISELFNYDENTMQFEEELYRFKSINNDTITCHIEDDNDNEMQDDNDNEEDDDNDNEIQDYSNESVENVNLEKDLKKKKMHLSMIEIDINIQKAQK